MAMAAVLYEMREPWERVYNLVHILTFPHLIPITRGCYAIHELKRLVKVFLHLASCIPSPKCTMGDVNGVSERSQQYGLWEFSQTLSSQYGAGMFSSVYACWHYLYMIHNTFRAWYATCNKTFTNLFEIAVYTPIPKIAVPAESNKQQADDCKGLSGNLLMNLFIRGTWEVIPTSVE